MYFVERNTLPWGELYDIGQDVLDLGVLNVTLAVVGVVGEGGGNVRIRALLADCFLTE